jgi:long-chain acyl-CoA synthetase
VRLTRDLTHADATAVIADFVGSVCGLPLEEVVAINGTTRFDAAGLGLDSLTRLQLAAAVASFFRLHESELEDELLRRRSVSEWADTVVRGWAEGSKCLTFLTSGTTAERIPCIQHWDLLAQELAVHAEMFATRRRVVGLVGARHIYGFLFCTLLPRWLGVPFVDARNIAPAGLATFARPGDLFVGFPLRWELIAPDSVWPPEVVGITSTGPIAAATITALRAQGLAQMVEIYGSTQTGGVGWRDTTTDPLRLYAHWSLRGDGQLQRANPHAPGPPLVFEAPDVLALRAGGFEVLRRRDGAIQVAGVNVSCAQVAARLAELPWVAECAVRLMRADEGSRLKAFVVLAQAMTPVAARTALRAWAGQHLSAAEIPTQLTLGAALPRDSHGKLTDWSDHQPPEAPV